MVRNDGAGQLALLPYHHEAAAELEGERRRDEESAGFDADQQVGRQRPDRLVSWFTVARQASAWASSVEMS